MPARRFAALLLVAAQALALVPLDARGGEAPTVEVEADRLRIDHHQRSAVFEGHVRARYGDLTLSCDAMSVSYDDEGAIVALRASGRVVVVRPGARATAATGRLDARQGLLVLEGGPVLVRGPHRLEGQRIAVHLSSGRLEVEKARGTFKLDLRGQP
jgi:lipopolysaccharide transport protein LptA